MPQFEKVVLSSCSEESALVVRPAFVLSWVRAALGPAGTLPEIYPPLRDRRRGLWHGDSHPGATIQMALRPRCALLWGATPDIVGRRHHPFAGGTRPNRRGYLLPGA